MFLRLIRQPTDQPLVHAGLRPGRQRAHKTGSPALLIIQCLVAIAKLSPAVFSKLTYSQVATDATVSILSRFSTPGADVGGAILLIWLVAWASGRSRPVPTWIDLAGRVLGAAWVLLAFMAVLLK